MGKTFCQKHSEFYEGTCRWCETPSLGSPAARLNAVQDMMQDPRVKLSPDDAMRLLDNAQDAMWASATQRMKSSLFPPREEQSARHPHACYCGKTFLIGKGEYEPFYEPGGARWHEWTRCGEGFRAPPIYTCQCGKASLSDTMPSWLGADNVSHTRAGCELVDMNKTGLAAWLPEVKKNLYGIPADFSRWSSNAFSQPAMTMEAFSKAMADAWAAEEKGYRGTATLDPPQQGVWSGGRNGYVIDRADIMASLRAEAASIEKHLLDLTSRLKALSFDPPKEH